MIITFLSNQRHNSYSVGQGYEKLNNYLTMCLVMLFNPLRLQVLRRNHNFSWRDSLGITMGTETSKESSSSHGWSNHSQPYTTDVAAFEAEQIKMREISRMDQTIRSRLHQGVKYNMKVLLCGERGTGKTMLWRRLQGQPFSYEVRATSV